MAASVLRATDPDFHQQMFGCRNFFPFYSVDGIWYVFHVDSSSRRATFFHGCTLWELWQILEDGVWKAGLWGGSPLAVWGATTPSAALDRSAAARGYAQTLSPCGIPNGWDSPVAIGFAFDDTSKLGFHKKLKNDVDLLRWSTTGRRTVPLGELPIVSLHIVEPHYNRLQELHTHWSDLEEGTLVLCRSRRCHPEDFFKSGHGNSWSCGRVTAYPNECGWMNSGKRWRCPICDWNHLFLKGSVTGER